jgi:hypothetical protein
VNKTLLLIICDFLLISILALVEFKPNIEVEAVDEQELRDQAAEEMLELLKLSLELENDQRQAVEQTLDETRSELTETAEALQEKESTLEQTSQALAETSTALQEREAEKEALSSTLEQTRSSLEMTLEEKQALAESLREREARSQQLQAELRAQQQEAAAKEAALAEARESLSQLETQQQQLSTQLQIRETEKQMLEQNLVTARAEVERARVEAERAQQQTENLAAGVGELAASSTALREEFRQAQPLSLNAIYKQFEDNRVFLRFQWEERAFLSTNTRQAALQTLLVDTPDGIRAVFATENTPFSGSSGREMNPTAILTIGERSFAVKEIRFLDSDPAIAAIRVPESIARDSGLRVFPLSQDPFRFSNAVLVSDDQELYGEIPVRVPPGETGTLEVESKLFNRLFGEFSPGAGDYVFSLTGELIGIMVRGDRARMLQEPAFTNPVDLQSPTD